MSGLVLDENGFTDLPDTKIAFVVTHLEMRSAPSEPIAPERDDVTLQRWLQPSVEAYRDLFRKVGGDWIWFGRLTKSDEDLEKMLRDPARQHLLPLQDGKPIGILELNYADPKNVEVAYFGLVPEAIGGGVGRWLMSQALEMAWARPETDRVWLHTCTGDSPQALKFYLSCGYRPFKRSVEIADDPRHLGIHPPAAAPHVPYLAG